MSLHVKKDGVFAPVGGGGAPASGFEGAMWPEPVFSRTTVTFAINAANHKSAWIFLMPESGDIASFLFRLTTSISTSRPVRMRMETPDSEGLPSGTLYHANGEATLESVIPRYNQFTFATPVPVTAGDPVCFVLSIDGEDAPNFSLHRQLASQSMNLPYTATFNGTAWTKSRYQGGAFFRYSNGRTPHIPSNWEFTNETTPSWSNNPGSGPLERGMKFVAPGPITVQGYYLHYSALSSFIGSYSIHLYNSDLEELTSVSVPTAFWAWTSSAMHAGYFSSPTNLQKGETYYLTIKPTSSDNIQMWVNSRMDADHATAPYSDLVYVTRVPPSSEWTENELQRPGMGLLLG